MSASMDTEWTPPDTWLVLLQVEDERYSVDPADEGMIDAAVQRFIESACTRDELLHLTLSEGGPYRVLVSRVIGWWLCTPEHRRRCIQREEMGNEWEKEMRADLGLPWKEED